MPERSAAGTVILLPGFGSTVDTDFGFVGPMLGREHRVIGWDATAPEPPIPLGPEDRVHVVGYGAGAARALDAVARGRLAAASVTLLAPVLTATTIDVELLSPAFRSLRPEVAPPVLDRARASAELDSLATLDLLSLAAGITAPMLVVRCTDDALAGPDDAERLVAAAPDARLALVDSGHAVLIERPAEVLALVAAFLARPHAHPACSTIRAVAA